MIFFKAMEHKRERTYEWTDPMALEIKAKSMSGIDFLNATAKGEVPPAPFISTLEFQLLSIEKGKTVFGFEPQEFHFNPIGCVHGGVISTLLDTVMGTTVQSALEQGFGYTTLELKVNFTRAVNLNSGKLTSTGKIIHLGRSTALVEADLRDGDGKLYAHGVSTCMILNLT